MMEHPISRVSAWVSHLSSSLAAHPLQEEQQKELLCTSVNEEGPGELGTHAFLCPSSVPREFRPSGQRSSYAWPDLGSGLRPWPLLYMVRPSRKDQDETVGAHEVNLASVLAAMGQVTLISASILPLSSDVIHRTVFIFLLGGG